ncbi:hypothetical protein AOXY_G27825 [Acipenser oxyrinchus oxyrinchus]|uniref:Uncharacterized protein n=1 Tax=Acipenser oxyrinchus oxyrinchus TaxID=40147 RepID=A0AAD8FWV9_ACIOX|nr:hypothetical protein AOXY_G27825 [Acipenser oxyrinchus oxyrinchus]
MIVRQKKRSRKTIKSSLPAAPAVPRPPSTSPATQRPQLFCFVEAVYGTDRRVKASDVEDLITDALRFTPHTGGKERQATSWN